MNTSSDVAHLEARNGLRPYQRTAVDLAAAELARNGRAHLALPTGSGKSRVLVELARHALDHGPAGPGTVLVVTPRTQITDQLAGAMRDTGHTVASLPGDRRVAAEVIVGTATSLRRWARQAGATPRLILIDEAHHATAPVCRALLDGHPDAHWVGVTATPYRHDGARLDEVLGRCVMVRDPDHPDLAGVLAPVTWSAVPLPVDLGRVPTNRSSGSVDYQPAALGAVLTTPTAIGATVTGTSDLIRHRPCVVFAATIEHGEALAEGYRAAGHRVGEIYSHTHPEERRRMIGQLRLGPDHPDGLGMVVNVTALTEGLDCPPVSALVIARPTRSELLYTQMLGRGLRRHPGKVDCLVLDVTGADDPANAPTAAGQVFAPTVTPVAGRGGLDGDDNDDTADTEPPWWSGGDRTVRQLVGTDRRSPAWSWSPGPDGIYVVPLHDGRTGVLCPDGDTGLFTPSIVINGLGGGVIELAGPLPARHAVDAFTGRADRHLTRADAKWRDEPVTVKQLTRMRYMEATVGAAAQAEGWTRGRTSDVLCAMIAGRHAGRRPNCDVEVAS